MWRVTARCGGIVDRAGKGTTRRTACATLYLGSQEGIASLFLLGFLVGRMKALSKGSKSLNQGGWSGAGGRATVYRRALWLLTSPGCSSASDTESSSYSEADADGAPESQETPIQDWGSDRAPQCSRARRGCWRGAGCRNFCGAMAVAERGLGDGTAEAWEEGTGLG